MAIYTRFGTDVIFTAARIVLVDGEPVWHVRAKLRRGGARVFRGKWTSAHWARADGGRREILAEMHRLNPDHATKFETWKAAGPAAAEMFGAVPEKDID